jgi:WASH complex subunit 7
MDLPLVQSWHSSLTLEGVAYILKLLDQYKQFDSLHWFEEVFNRYAEEQKKVDSQISKQKKEEQQTAILTIAKLKGYLTEFQLLQFSFDGARIFFKD